MRPRLLILTQWFDPEPTFKGLAFAQGLAREGFDVEVLTGFPNYPGGKVYPGYRMKLLQREQSGAVTVTRVPLYPSHDQSALKRVANYASFAASATLYGLFFARRPDVIYAYHPPLTVGVAASIIKLLRRVPVVYDIQDMWPDTLRATGMLSSERLLRVVGKVCDWVYRRADRLVVLSAGFKALLLRRGLPSDKVHVVYNWADETALARPAASARPAWAPDKFKIVFAGNMGKAQALHSVCEAARLLQQRNTRIQFVFVGGGVELPALKEQVARLALANVVFEPAVPMNEVGALLAQADVLLVSLKRDPLFEITIPSKTQAYMFMGKPILLAGSGDAADIVEAAGCGLAVPPEDPAALAQAAERLASMGAVELEQMGQRGRSHYTRHLSMDHGLAAFADLLRGCSSQARAASAAR